MTDKCGICGLPATKYLHPNDESNRKPLCDAHFALPEDERRRAGLMAIGLLPTPDRVCKGCGFIYGNLIGAIDHPDFCFQCLKEKL